MLCGQPGGVAAADLPLKLEEGTRPLFVIGQAEVQGETLRLGAQSFAILG